MLDLLSSSGDIEKKITITINDSALGQQLINAFHYLRHMTTQPQPDKIVLIANSNFSNCIDYSPLFFILNNIAPFTKEMETDIQQFFKLQFNRTYLYKFHQISSEKYCALYTPRPLKELAKLATGLKGVEKLPEDIQKISFSQITK